MEKRSTKIAYFVALGIFIVLLVILGLQFKGKENPCKPKCPKAFQVFRGLRLEPEPHAPKSRALPTALHPDIQFFCMIPREEEKSKFFVSVGGAVVKPGFAGGSSGGGFPPQATVPRTSGVPLLGEWMSRLSSQSRRATNCATPG